MQELASTFRPQATDPTEFAQLAAGFCGASGLSETALNREGQLTLTVDERISVFVYVLPSHRFPIASATLPTDACGKPEILAWLLELNGNLASTEGGQFHYSAADRVLVLNATLPLIGDRQAAFNLGLEHFCASAARWVGEIEARMAGTTQGFTHAHL